MRSKLTVTDHDRSKAGLKYVYPVMSRRSGGLSIGVNFNVNNACNWRCIYCQVPNLTLGAPPAIDFDLLERELRSFLHNVQCGDFFDRFEIEAGQRLIKDIAISGNGEPTSVADFSRALDLIGRIANEADLLPNAGLVLITNGSLIHQKKVQAGLSVLHRYGGEVWFKLDSATLGGRREINHTFSVAEVAYRNLIIASTLCRTKIQTCFFSIGEAGLDEEEMDAFFKMLSRIKQNSEVNEVLLYTLARPSMQPEAKIINPLPAADLAKIADEIKALGFIGAAQRLTKDVQNTAFHRLVGIEDFGSG